MKTLIKNSYEWGQAHALKKISIYFKEYKMLPKFPVSDKDWDTPWKLFSSNFSEEYPYYNETMKNIAWKIYKNGWTFAYNYIEKAIKVIKENIKDYIDYFEEIPPEDLHFDSNVGLYLNSLPEIDDELISEYTNTLAILHSMILKQYQENNNS